MNNYLRFIFLSLFVLILSSCNDNDMLDNGLENSRYDYYVTLVDKNGTKVNTGEFNGFGGYNSDDKVTISSKNGACFKLRAKSTNGESVDGNEASNNLTTGIKSDWTVTIDGYCSNLTVISNDENMGNVSGSGAYLSGDTLAIEAQPKEGYEFEGWELEKGSYSISDNTKSSTNVIANLSACTIKAIFHKQFKLSDYLFTMDNGLFSDAELSFGNDRDTKPGWYKIAAGNGRYIAIGKTSQWNTHTGQYDYNCFVAVSLNGNLWTQYAIGESGDCITDIVFGNGVFAACGSASNGYGVVFLSTDGIIWQRHTYKDPDLKTNFIMIAYGNGTYVARDKQELYYSANAIDWKRYKIADGQRFYGYKSIKFLNGQFVDYAYDYALYASVNGKDWAKLSVMPYTESGWNVIFINDVAYGNGLHVAAGSDYVNISNDNCASWSKTINTSTTTNYQGKFYSNRIVYYNGFFIRLGQWNYLVHSNGTSSWQNDKYGYYSYSTTGKFWSEPKKISSNQGFVHDMIFRCY